ncbi:MAG: cold shock domain-containing protein [Gammaproteobacteria bacterium TMED92]|nr:MAG: cold shock domain-containing protein [Gammaproteobacteria bacterium TMED92]
MPKGSVKWFNNAKGYGFIVADDNTTELFAHYSAIAMDGYKTLNAGELVEFELQHCDKGLQAKNIRRCATDKLIVEAGDHDNASSELSV